MDKVERGRRRHLLRMGENKNLSNFSKHGIDFTDAVSVFFDECALIKEDRRSGYSEVRYRIIAAPGLLVMVVVYTEPHENTVRIISARRANRTEQEEYIRGIG